MFNGIFIFLLALLAFFTSSEEIIFKPSDHFLADITDPSKEWIFKNDNGYLGPMKFEPNGTISKYDHPNERYWRIENGALTLLNKDKNPTCRFVQLIQDFRGKWHAQGLFIGSSNGWRHYLEEV